MIDLKMIQMIETLKKEVEHKGSKALMQFGKTFANVSSKKSSKPKKKSTTDVALKEESLALTTKQTKELAKFFEKDPEGGVTFENAFIVPRDKYDGHDDKLMKAKMHFNKDGSGQVVIEELQGNFNLEDYEEYKEGNMTKEELFKEVLRNHKHESPFSLGYSRLTAKIDDDNNFSISNSSSMEHIF